MPTFGELLEQYRKQDVYRPEDVTNPIAQSLINLLVFPNVGGPKTPEEAQAQYEANLQRPDIQGFSARAGVDPAQMAIPFSRESLKKQLALPPTARFGKKALRFGSAALPYVGAGIATAPIAAEAGTGTLAQVLKGQVLQEAAFLPSTLASSESLPQAAATTALGVGFGSLLGMLGRGRPAVKPPAPDTSVEDVFTPQPAPPYRPPDLEAIERQELEELGKRIGWQPTPLKSPLASKVSAQEIDIALAAPPVSGAPTRLPVEEAPVQTALGESARVPLSRTEMNEIRAEVTRNAGSFGNPQEALQQLERMERVHQAGIRARTNVLQIGDPGSMGADVIQRALQDVSPALAQSFRAVLTGGRPLGILMRGRKPVTLAQVEGISDAAAETLLRHETGHLISRRLGELASTGDVKVQQTYDTLRNAVSYQPWRMWDEVAEAQAEVNGLRAQWPEDIALRVGKPPGWKNVHGKEGTGKVDERMADLVALMSSSAGRESISPKARRILAPVFGDFSEGYRPKFSVGGDVQVIPKGQLTSVASATKADGTKIEAGTVAEQVQKRELSTKVAQIQADVIQAMQGVDPKMSTAQAEEWLKGGRATTSIAKSLRKQGRPDLAEALEKVAGIKGLEAPPHVPTAAERIATLQQALDELGPKATKMFDEQLDDMPPALLARFLSESEDGFIRTGADLSVKGLWDQLMFFRRGAMVTSLRAAVTNVLSTAQGASAIPRALLSAAFAKTGKAVLGRGPERTFTEAAILPIGYVRGAANMVRVLRNRLGLSAAQGDPLMRFAEATRQIRQQIEGGDPFAESGAIGQALGTIPRLGMRFTLEEPDRMMFDVAFGGELLRSAYRSAVDSGARGAGQIRKGIQEFLDRATRDAAAAETAAMRRVEAEAPRAARGRAEAQGREAIQAAKGLMEKARVSGRGVDDARNAYNAAVQKANTLIREAQLSPAEKEFMQRAIMRELAPQSIQEAQLLAERALFIAQEGKRLDNSITWLSTAPYGVSQIVDMVLPFKRTPANVARESMRYSPAGFLTAPIKLAQAGGYSQLRAAGVEPLAAWAQSLKNADDAGLSRFYDDLAQATFGTSLFVGTTALLANNYISVTPPGLGMKREERLALEAQGTPTDSLIVGDYAVPLYRLEPLGRVIRAAAQAVRLAEGGDPTAGQIGEALAQEFVANMGNDTWLSGLQDLMEASEGGASAAAYANKFGGSFVPRIVQDLQTQRKDRRPTENAAKEFVKGFVQATGGGKPELGLFGKPRTQDRLYALTGYSLRADDPLLQEMTAIDYFPSTRLPKGDFTEGERFDATQAKGFAQEQALKQLLANPQYQEIQDPAVRKRVMERQMQIVGNTANAVIKARKQSGMSLSYSDLLQVLTR